MRRLDYHKILPHLLSFVTTLIYHVWVSVQSMGDIGVSQSFGGEVTW